MEKYCKYCSSIKNISEFHKQKNGKFGVTSKCKLCKKNYWDNNKIDFSDKAKERYKNNKEHRKEKGKQYYENNKSVKISKYRKQNKRKIKEYQKLYSSDESYRNKLNKKRRDRYTKDLIYRLSCVLRSRLSTAISKDYKKSSAIVLIGLTLEDFKEYISSQFIGSMSWDNFGILWELDHIKPVDSFDLSYEKQQQKCFNYKNYQPLYSTTELAIEDGCTDCIGNKNKSNKI